MALTYRAKPSTMEFCLDCHRDPAPHLRPHDSHHRHGHGSPSRCADARRAAGRAERHPRWPAHLLLLCVTDDGRWPRLRHGSTSGSGSPAAGSQRSGRASRRSSTRAIFATGSRRNSRRQPQFSTAPRRREFLKLMGASLLLAGLGWVQGGTLRSRAAVCQSAGGG